MNGGVWCFLSADPAVWNLFMPEDRPSPRLPLTDRKVERAIDDLRRGWPVLVRDGDGAFLGLATEAAAGERGTLKTLAQNLVLVLTAQRAAALHLKLRDERAAAIALTDAADWAMMASLADATQDLERPLRGPLASADVPAGAAPALRLAKQARLLPSLIGGAPRLAPGQTLEAFAALHDLTLVEADAVETHEATAIASLHVVADARLPTALAERGRLVAFRAADGAQEHMALVIGDPKPRDPVLVRLHSECFTGDILGSLRCDCGDQLKGAMARMAVEGGVLLYMRQEGRGIGLVNKLRAYHVQDQGFDTLDANLRLGFEADERLFRPAALLLKALGFTRVRLLTNNPDKVEGLKVAGIDVVERVPHAFPAHAHNEDYQRTKAKRSGHYLDVGPKAKDTP
jgi:GTP cyclohydrolase II